LPSFPLGDRRAAKAFNNALAAFCLVLKAALKKDRNSQEDCFGEEKSV
jgi:hypothetical protein